MAREASVHHYDRLLPHRVVLRIPYADDARWNAIFQWLNSDEIDGRYGYIDISEAADEQVDLSVMSFRFSDPDAAFHFKVRWA